MVAVEAAAVGRAGDESAVGDGVGGGGEFPAAGQDVAGVAGHGGGGLPIEAGAGIHEGELREAHVHHGAAGRPDVAAVDGVDEHDADVVQGDHGNGMIRTAARKDNQKKRNIGGTLALKRAGGGW